ncbi:hypothetical protein MOVS_00335 [Moraxella ovis]|uniref:PQ loop repeat n=1 Tax=Moraxella ovis TaxID=29433 RepID=A0ABM6BAS8_9GAMM|nr:hypothetical protein MOVS_00335 [Moraxella ovis]
MCYATNTSMLTIYIIATIGLFLGWARNIPKIQQNFWLDNILLALAITILTWCCINITKMLNNMTSDNLAFTHIIIYIFYMIAMNIVFCYATKKISKNR